VLNSGDIKHDHLKKCHHTHTVQKHPQSHSNRDRWTPATYICWESLLFQRKHTAQAKNPVGLISAF